MTKTNLKHSGVEWLGQIPKHWEIVPLKAVFQSRNEDNRNLKYTQILSLLKDIGVIPYEEKGAIGNKSKENLSGYKIARKNDFILNKMNAVIGSLGVSNYDGLVSPIYLILYITNSNYFLSFYSYIFQSKEFQKSLKQYAYGIMDIRESIDFLEFKNAKLPLPPLNEQRQIAEFLDKKCEKISEFIAKKQRLITLLKEQKQTLINECVCGRLDFVIESERNEVSPSLRDFAAQNRGNPQKTTTKGIDCHEVVPTSRNDKIAFQHSGVEWLGQIPKHWEVRKLKQIGVFSKGNNITKKYISNEGLPFILYGDIYTKYNFKAVNIANKISSENANLASLVKKNTLLFSASGEIVEDIGKCIVLLADFTYIGGDVITLNIKDCDSIFLSYALNSTFAIYQKALMGKGDIIVHIHILNLKNLQIPLPPLNEQRQIAEFLDKKCEKIDKAIRLVEQEINKMKEYKTSLIDKAVKGQINA